jgi:hypothetical protein
MLLLNAPHRPNSTLKIIKAQLTFHVDYHDIRLSQSVSFWIYRIITCAVIFRFGLQLLYNDGAWKIWSKTFWRVVKVHFLSTFWVFHIVMYLPWTVYWIAYVSNLLVNRHMDKQNEVLMEAYRSMLHELQKLQVGIFPLHTQSLSWVLRFSITSPAANILLYSWLYSPINLGNGYSSYC